MSRLAACFAVSAVIGNGVMAQEMVSSTSPAHNDEGNEAGYCEPVLLATPIATEYFNLLGCDDGFMSEELMNNAPKVDSDFVLPTIEQFNAGDSFARCVYGSLPGGIQIVDEAFGMVGTGNFLMTEESLEDIKRVAAYSCLQMS